jgi:hypothetical protein
MWIIRLFGLVSLLLMANITQAEKCTNLGVKNQIGKTKVIHIEKPGSYCLEESFGIKEFKEFDIHAGSFKYQSPTIIGIHASNVNLDLMRNQLTSQSSRDYAQGVSISKQNNILIGNGYLKSAAPKSIGIIHNPSGSSYISIPSDKKYLDYKTTLDVDHPQGQDVSYLDSIDKLPPKYQDANITIDNMHIFATYRGVQLADNHNTIRNSTIEVDDNTAIYLMGQYPVIENNTIIIHSNKNGDTETQKKYNIQIKDGAIKLRDAQGGIIRNNRIIYKGGFLGFGIAPVAINLLDSKDVLIEGNTIEGFDKLVRENGDTSFTENNNIIK